MTNWNEVRLVPEFDEQGVACYKLDGADYLNEYYVVSEAETRKLLNTPEIVGYEVYNCLIPSTSQMLYYLKEQKKVTTANILSILRGALNYPLEESCYREHIRVHDISFLSSERVFREEEGKPNDLLERIAADPAFGMNMEQLQAIMKPENFVGRAPQQTEEFVAEVINPILEENKEVLGLSAEINV